MPTEQYSLWRKLMFIQVMVFWVLHYVVQRFVPTFRRSVLPYIFTGNEFGSDGAASFLNIHLKQIESPWRRGHNFLPYVSTNRLYWTVTRHNLPAGSQGTVMTLVFTVTVLTIVGVIRNFFLQFEVAAVGVSVWRVGISRARTMPRTWRFLYDALWCRAVDVGHFRLLSC